MDTFFLYKSLVISKKCIDVIKEKSWECFLVSVLENISTLDQVEFLLRKIIYNIPLKVLVVSFIISIFT